MKLPLVDEVRAARAAAVEAQRAFQDVARVEAALRAVALVEADGRPTPTVPGEDELRELAAAWPALSGLAEPPPPGPTRLAAQRARLEAARAWLAPRGEGMHASFAALGDAQRRQQEALAAPRWRRSAEAVRKRIETRGGVEHALLPLESELVRLGIVARFLGEWLGRLVSAPPDERDALRGALGESLAPMLDGLPSEVTGPLAADAAPDPDAWRALAGRVEARRAALERQAGQLRRERDRLQDWLAERIG